MLNNYLVNSGHRNPPPYPGPYRHLYLPGYRQSYSGSEASTDFSISSSENLSMSARQDPQGEETAQILQSPLIDHAECDQNYSILSRLGLSSNDVEIQPNLPNPFYVTCNSSRPSSTSPMSDTGEMSNLLHLIGSTSYSSQATGSPSDSACSMPSNIYSAANSFKFYHPISNQDNINTAQQPNVTNTPMNKELIHDMQQANRILEDQCQRYLKTQQQERYMQKILNLQHQHISTTNESQERLLQTPIERESHVNCSYPPTEIKTQAEINVQMASLMSTPQNAQNNQNSFLKSNKTREDFTGGKNQHNMHASIPALPMPPEGYILNPIAKPKQNSYALKQTDQPENFILPKSHKTQTQLAPSCPVGHMSTLLKEVPSQNSALTTDTLQSGRQSQRKTLRRSFEMVERSAVTRSQPDLTKIVGDSSNSSNTLASNSQKNYLALPPNNSDVSTSPGDKTDFLRNSPKQNAVVNIQKSDTINRLSRENKFLRKEIESYNAKVFRLQQFEMNIKKVSDAYENLVKHSKKRENLETMMRIKLDNEVKRFQDINRDLKDQLDRALCQLERQDIYNTNDSELHREISKKDSMIARLLAQNKEISSTSDRLDIMTSSQRNALKEQRTHIEMLDKALNIAQARILRLEEELRKKIIQDEKIDELQKAVTQLQIAAAKREAVELRLRNKLEEEIGHLKKKYTVGVNKPSDTDEGIASDCESTSGQQQGSLKQQLGVKEQQLLMLEAQVLKWEQRYLEESALRSLAINAASMPKDIRIAALEKNSEETEKIIADARSERLSHLEEVYKANRRAAELEAKLTSHAAQLAEKDAMISILQKQNVYSSRPSSATSLLSSSPLTSPLPTLSSPIPSSLSSFINSTMASIMSLSQSLPSSGTSSPHGSTVSDSTMYQQQREANHTMSSSIVSTMSNNNDNTNPETLRELQHRLAAQAALLNSIQSGGDQLSRVMWQV